MFEEDMKYVRTDFTCSVFAHKKVIDKSRDVFTLSSFCSWCHGLAVKCVYGASKRFH